MSYLKKYQDILIEKIEWLSKLEELEDLDVHQLDITSNLDKISSDLNRNRIQVAVAGEFSSGKSTLINALLRDEILVTSPLVATQVITKIRAGKNKKITVRYRNKDLVTIESEQEICRQLQEFTADEVISQTIEQVELIHPAKILKSAIELIDTPGSNAEQEEHQEISQKLIAEGSDLAIVVIPATQALSRSLVAFIESFPRHYLSNCIFIVTRMDAIRERERGSLLNNVRSRLMGQLKIVEPRLYSCSAQAVIEFLSGSSEEFDHQWHEQFEDMENQISQYLLTHQEPIILQSHFRRLGSINQELLQQLNWIKSSKLLELESLEIDQYKTLKHLWQAQQTQWRQTSHNHSLDQAVRLDLALSQSQGNLKTELEQLIQKCQTSEEVEAMIQQKFGTVVPLSESVKATVQSVLDFPQNSLKGWSDSVNQSMQSIILSGNAEKLLQAQDEGVANTGLSELKPKDLQQKVSQRYGTYLQERKRIHPFTLLSGTVVGAILFAAVEAPAFGAFIGFPAAGGLSLLATRPGLSDRKAKVTQIVSEELGTVFEGYQTHLKAQFSQQVEKSQTLQAETARVIESLLSELKTESKQKQKQLERIQSQLTEISRIQGQLDCHQKDIEACLSELQSALSAS